MEAESAVLWVMSGDKFEWEVEISSQSRIYMVYAFFFKETEDPNPRQLALGGEVYLAGMPRMGIEFSFDSSTPRA